MKKFNKIVKFLFANWQQLIAAGNAYVEWGVFLYQGIKALLSKTPNGEISEVTDEMMEELKNNWPGPLPEPNSIFGPDTHS